MRYKQLPTANRGRLVTVRTWRRSSLHATLTEIAAWASQTHKTHVAGPHSLQRPFERVDRPLEDSLQVNRTSKGSTKRQSKQHTQNDDQPGPLDTQTWLLHPQVPFRQALDDDSTAEGRSSHSKGQAQRDRGTGLTFEHNGHSTAWLWRQHTRMGEQQSLHGQPVFPCPFAPLVTQVGALTGFPLGCQQAGKPTPYILPRGSVPLPKVPSNCTLKSQGIPPCTKLSNSYNESTLLSLLSTPTSTPRCPYTVQCPVPTQRGLSQLLGALERKNHEKPSLNKKLHLIHFHQLYNGGKKAPHSTFYLPSA